MEVSVEEKLVVEEGIEQVIVEEGDDNYQKSITFVFNFSNYNDDSNSVCFECSDYLY